MKRNYLLLMLILSIGVLIGKNFGSHSLELISNSPQETILEYKITNFDKTELNINGQSWHQVSLAGEGQSQEKGEPALPNFNRSIIIDPSAKMKLEIFDVKYDEITLAIAPSKGIVTRDIDYDSVPYTFGEIYQSNQFYPQNIATLSEPYILRDYRALTIQSTPFAYRADTKTLRVYTSFKVRVYAEGKDTINTLSGMPGEISSAFLPIYENHFANWQSYRYVSVNDDFGKLLVISHSSFMTAIQPWVNWKRQKGIETELVNFSTIGSTAAQLKTYIQNKYNADNQLTFVQLVGDAPQIPTLTHSSGGSDPSFSLVAGNDNYPDIFIGRFSAQTVSELNIQINRSIAYERDLNASDTWLARGMGIASSEGGSGGDNGETDIQHMNNIRNKLLNYGYTSVDQLHEPAATSAQVTTNVNQGRGIINYVGHGADTYWVTTSFNNTAAMALTNGNKAPFIVSVACVNGNFVSQTCFAEAWLRAPNGGAITMYASTINQSWASPMRAQDEIADLWVADSKSTAGGYYYNGSCKMMDTYGSDGVNMFKTWIIFGDASLVVRSKTPQAMTVNHPQNLLVGANTLSVSTGVANSLVALTLDGEIYGKGYTNASGNVNLILSELPAGLNTFTLTATAYNRITYVGEIQQSAADEAYLIVSEINYADNNNQIPEYSESGRFNVSFHNAGSVAANNVSATITSSSPYITFTNASQALGNIAADATLNVSNAFSFNIAANTPHEAQAAFEIQMQSGNQSWNYAHSIQINAPRLEFGEYQILDSGGNNNGRLDPGETATLRIALQNMGLAASPAGNATISCQNAGISFSSNNATFSSILAGGSVQLDYTITVQSNVAQGTIANVILNAFAAAYQASASLPLEIGAPETVTIGTGSYTQTYPLNRYYGYSTHEAIYLASELGSAGNISAMAYYKNSGTNTDPIESVSIYMKHTSANTISAGSYSTTGYTLVYSGDFTNDATSGWMEVELTNRFAYDGVQNLSILVLKGYQNWVSAYPNWRYTSTSSGYRARQGQSDSSQPSSLSTSGNLPNLRLKIFAASVDMAEINVNPTSFDESMNAGSSQFKTLAISNTGNIALSWTATSDVDWILPSQNNGTISAGANRNLLFTINALALGAGDYTGNIIINSNAANNPVLSVPVSLQVVLMPINPRMVAEWEPAKGAVVRYPFGQPYSLLKNLSEDALLYVIVSSSSQSAANSQMQLNGVNMSNVRYINAATDSYWVRDYAAWSIFEGDNSLQLVDFNYNRPRPNDNLIPGVMANYLDTEIFDLALNHTGGNMMTDGMGKAMSTDLVYRENTSFTQAQVNERMQSILGITDYQIYSDPLTTGSIDHIDCWAKILDVDKVMIIRVPMGHVNYNAIEASVAEWQQNTSSYGTPYRIFRVDAPNNEPYANSFIMNDKIYLPLMGTASDAAALAAYENAMPGYQVRGYTHSGYISDDALHCRVNTIFDEQMIAIRHIPESDLTAFEDYTLSFEIDKHADLDNEYSYLAYSQSLDGPWQYATLSPDFGRTYSATVNAGAYLQNLYYYVQVQDINGKKSRLPLCGELDPFVVSVSVPNPVLPAWSIVPYSNPSAEIYVEIDFFGAPAQFGDLLGAFAGEECRGLLLITDTAPQIMRVQLALDGESLNFRLFSQSENDSFEALESVTLGFGETVGSAQPVLLSFELGIPQLSYILDANSLIVSWAQIPNADTYQVLWAESPDAEFQHFLYTTELSFSSPLDLPHRFYKVKALKGMSR